MLSKNQKYTRQKGFSLVELMIAIVIGLIVAGAGISLLVNTADTDFDALKITRLNQELRAVMNLMVRDIRRAGYNAGVGNLIAAGAWNPFIRDTGGNLLFSLSDINNVDSNTATKDCIIFAYDANNNGVDDGNSERFGYRLMASAVNTSWNTVKARQNGALCSSTSNSDWTPLSDDSTIEIRALTFTPRSSRAGSSNTLIICSIDISLTGRYGNLPGYDPTVERTINETVKLRNEIYDPTGTSAICQ